jgi:hypothetical protein
MAPRDHDEPPADRAPVPKRRNEQVLQSSLALFQLSKTVCRTHFDLVRAVNAAFATEVQWISDHTKDAEIYRAEKGGL